MQRRYVELRTVKSRPWLGLGRGGIIWLQVKIKSRALCTVAAGPWDASEVLVLVEHGAESEPGSETVVLGSDATVSLGESCNKSAQEELELGDDEGVEERIHCSKMQCTPTHS